MKTLLFSAAVLCVAAPALALSAPTPKPATAPMPSISRAEMIQKVQDHFGKLDTNKDGFVTKDEMQAAEAAMRERFANHMQERESAVFDRIDTNKDGSISRAEFDAAHKAMIANHAGIPGGAMRGAHGMHGLHGAMAGRMFATADANNDGRVSLQEATAAATAHFDKIDANHDGVLTPDEMRAGHNGMWRKGGRR
jgi:Ca2+-binding EF-hand superfamily protein